jgi:hypothetical protein
MTKVMEIGPRGKAGPIHLWNPVGFDPVEFLGESLRKRSDLARFVAHKIVWAGVFKRTNTSGFVQLKAEYLRKFFPDSQIYKRVMAGLVDGGAIECDGSYVRGQKCLGYKLNPELSRMRQTRVPVLDTVLARKIARARDESSQGLQPVHRYLLGHLKTVRIDVDAATETFYAGDFHPVNETAIQFIAAGDWRLIVCDYGRVHTNLTNLKSKFRRFLSVNGETLVNLDIRNSQPLVFASILRDRFGQSKLPADVNKYIDLCESGTFYDHLMQESGIPAKKRSAFKKSFFRRVFFCKNDPPTKAAVAFGEVFPNVYRVIRDLKADQYQALAHSLQRRESSIMIGGVATRCMLEIPAAFVGTIHDSILCHPRYAEQIRQYIMESFSGVGLIPTIRIENPQPILPGRNPSKHKSIKSNQSTYNTMEDCEDRQDSDYQTKRVIRYRGTRVPQIFREGKARCPGR